LKLPSLAATGAALGLLLWSALPSTAAPYDRWYGFYNPWNYPIRCLTHREIVRGLADYGFSRIGLSMLTHTSMLAQARLGRSTYLINVDYCDGHIEGLISIGPR